MNNSQAQTIDKFPMLGDLPVLGALFRSDHFQNGQTELVVIITPYIVKPSQQKLSLPTDGLAPPSEHERIIGLRTTSANPEARPMSGDPVAVPAAPQAAPVAPVSASSAATQAPALQPAATKPAAAAKSAPAAPAARPSTAPASAPPLVLHGDGDKDKRSGGLLVE